MMNNLFSLRRFGWLFRKTLLEKPFQLIGSVGLMFAVAFIIYVFCKSQIGFPAAQNFSFIWGFAGGGCFYASLIFSYFGSNASGSSYLTLPASSFEKWLCAVLIAGILYPALFMLFYRILDSSFVAIYHNGLDPASTLYAKQYAAVSIFSFNNFIAQKAYPIFIFLAGSMLLGSLYFNKVNFIKVAITICVICFSAILINWLIAKLMFGEINDAFPFTHVAIPVGKEEGFIEPPKDMANICYYLFVFIVPLLLWGISFIRLREKEF